MSRGSPLGVEGVTVRYGDTLALDAVGLAVPAGETLAVLGPSGSGKSTLLRVIAGLERPDAGHVLLEGNDVTDVPTHRRGVGLMFQDYALFPHRDVRGNVAFGPRMQGLPRAAIDERVGELLELVGLPDAGGRDVATLSGGERQRVALARALAADPRVLLLDEPLGALDAPLRARLADELADLFGRLDLTVVYVTHDVGEASAVGDRLAIVRDGRVVQVGTADDLWQQPADAWVARFLGMVNIDVLPDGRLRVVRPEAVAASVVPSGGDAVVEQVERRGALVRLRLRRDSGEALESVTLDPRHPRVGDRVRVSIDPGGVLELADGSSRP